MNLIFLLFRKLLLNVSHLRPCLTISVRHLGRKMLLLLCIWKNVISQWVQEGAKSSQNLGLNIPCTEELRHFDIIRIDMWNAERFLAGCNNLASPFVIQIKSGAKFWKVRMSIQLVIRDAENYRLTSIQQLLDVVATPSILYSFSGIFFSLLTCFFFVAYARALTIMQLQASLSGHVCMRSFPSTTLVHSSMLLKCAIPCLLLALLPDFFPVSDRFSRSVLYATFPNNVIFLFWRSVPVCTLC